MAAVAVANTVAAMANPVQAPVQETGKASNKKTFTSLLYDYLWTRAPFAYAPAEHWAQVEAAKVEAQADAKAAEQVKADAIYAEAKADYAARAAKFNAGKMHPFEAAVFLTAEPAPVDNRASQQQQTKAAAVEAAVQAARDQAAAEAADDARRWAAGTMTLPETWAYVCIGRTRVIPQ